MQFNTKCLFQATALIIETGAWPDNYFKVATKTKDLVICHWENIPDDTIKRLINKDILVEPLGFRDVFYQLKDIIFEITDGEKKDGKSN